jgi:hypothetical protein
VPCPKVRGSVVFAAPLFRFSPFLFPFSLFRSCQLTLALDMSTFHPAFLLEVGLIEIAQRGNTMEKILIKVSYWLGVVCVALAMLSKALNAIGVDFAQFNTRGNEIGYRSFVVGAGVFLLLAVATESYDAFNKRNP